jgi:hypothetical protein
MNAWVSAADTISYFVINPSNNPSGTVNLVPARWYMTVQKKIAT